MLAGKAMELGVKLSIAIAVYAIMRTVHTARATKQKLDASVLLRLYCKQGMQGSKARAVIRKQESILNWSRVDGYFHYAESELGRI